MKSNILTVIVLYKQKISDSPAYTLLKEAVLLGQTTLLVVDNSPNPQDDPLFKINGISYVHEPTNPGLASAYNRGLKAGADLEWLVSLDQDTKIASDYYEKLLELPAEKHIAAAVPKIFAGERQISPLYASDYIDRTAKPVERIGETAERIMAVNSGTAFSIRFLKKIGGFNPAFSLDFLDHWVFWRIYQEKETIYVLPVRFEHELSVLDYKKMSIERYRSITEAENLFYQKYDTKHLKQHKKQLVLRTIKHFLTVRDRKIWRQTLRTFIQSRKV
ncbi:glycosyltransferase, group 2 family protein [Enterococcus faecalis 13-SD-W-01]|nr:glycosyltransferase, group 2 family protein [Enterococcus faecalis 13-SD-W-01]